MVVVPLSLFWLFYVSLLYLLGVCVSIHPGHNLAPQYLGLSQHTLLWLFLILVVAGLGSFLSVPNELISSFEAIFLHSSQFPFLSTTRVLLVCSCLYNEAFRSMTVWKTWVTLIIILLVWLYTKFLNTDSFLFIPSLFTEGFDHSTFRNSNQTRICYCYSRFDFRDLLYGIPLERNTTKLHWYIDGMLIYVTYASNCTTEWNCLVSSMSIFLSALLPVLFYSCAII